jgi:hypothetical protein
VDAPKIEERVERGDGATIEGESCRRCFVVDEPTPVGPDERSDPDDLRIHAEPVDIDRPVVVAIAGELLRGGDHVVPVPPVPRELDPRVLEEIVVVVHDEARHVLRHAHLFAVPPERRHRGLEEVGLREGVGLLEVRSDGLQGSSGRELAVEPVVHQEEVGWLPARDRRGESQDQIVALGEGGQLGIHRSLCVVETRDDGTVRVDLLGIAGDHYGDPNGVGASLALARDRSQQEHPCSEPDPSTLPHHARRS